MNKFFTTIISHLKNYHYRLNNSIIRQIIRSSNYCLDEFNNDAMLIHICTFWMSLIMIYTLLLVK